MYQCGYGWHKDPCTIITLQGLEIVSDGPGALGFSVLEGWTGGTAATGGPVPWGNADGGVHGDVFFGPRTITIEGDIDAPDHESFADLVEEVGSVLTRPRRDLLVVDESVHLGLVRQVEVVRLRPPMITQLGTRHAVFTIVVEAASHLRVDETEQSVAITAAGTAMQNIGNASAHPVVSLVGPLTNPGLTWPDGAWSYAGTIASGTTLVVDMARRTVRNPATSAHSRNLASGSWLALPPGETLVKRTGTGNGSVSVEWRSAWS